MQKFIQLTVASTGNPRFINMDHLSSFEQEGDRTAIIYGPDAERIIIQEPIETLLLMLGSD